MSGKTPSHSVPGPTPSLTAWRTDSVAAEPLPLSPQRGRGDGETGRRGDVSPSPSPHVPQSPQGRGPGEGRSVSDPHPNHKNINGQAPWPEDFDPSLLQPEEQGHTSHKNTVFQQDVEAASGSASTAIGVEAGLGRLRATNPSPGSTDETPGHDHSNYDLGTSPGPAFLPRNLDFILDIPLEISVVLGHTRIRIADILKLGQGAIIELSNPAGSALEVLVNHRAIAKGEVVVVNEKYGIRLTEILSIMERIEKLR